MPVASVAERNADERHSVALCRRDERPAAFFGEARLYADNIVICAEQAVVIYEQARRRAVMQGNGFFAVDTISAKRGFFSASAAIIASSFAVV